MRQIEAFVPIPPVFTSLSSYRQVELVSAIIFIVLLLKEFVDF